MHYLIGDVQGCCGALQRLLEKIDFSASRDRLFVLGDMVNRGPQSLATLRLLRGLGDAASCLLGNHDLHLLAAAHGVRKVHRSDTLDDILTADDREAWIDWVRWRPLAIFDDGWLMVHAGVVPQWDREQTMRLAAEVETRLRGPDLTAFLQVMYGNQPARWDDALDGDDRLRLVINALTRTRFLLPDGSLDFTTKEGVDEAPPGLTPWFDAPGRRTAGQPIAFGHWSRLGLINRPNLVALDTGCVWGGALSALRIDGGRRELIQVDCAASATPNLN
ncbi:symmetrical bis(5'-nucleosyl)-tetraphosphatase [Piscinibacter sakaiensis]|uniref:symmetrical bis(5'-nucleosyl)-tetraphosphatase n=1 Tax=Piscinibacter sakaiensis TaxID=1547922 RepID=UPI003AACC918